MSKTTLGVIIGNRDFFPSNLVTEGRKDILAVFDEMGIEPVILNEDETELGGVETREDAKKCAALFKAKKDIIDGVLVVLPNFGDEKGVADTIRMSELEVPILIQAYPDEPDGFTIERRRDAFHDSICCDFRFRDYCRSGRSKCSR